jgi:hypothetical protein
MFITVNKNPVAVTCPVFIFLQLGALALSGQIVATPSPSQSQSRTGDAITADAFRPIKHSIKLKAVSTMMALTIMNVREEPRNGMDGLMKGAMQEIIVAPKRIINTKSAVRPRNVPSSSNRQYRTWNDGEH